MLLLVDLDGVVYRGTSPVPGVAGVLADRSARGDFIIYVTNSSIWHHEDFVERLSRMGAPVSPDHIVSGARASALYLAGLSPRPKKVLVVGAPGLCREMADAGFDVLRAADAAAAWAANGHDAAAATAGVEAVVVGLDMEIDWSRLVVAANAVRTGARFVAVNRDPIHPTEHGLVPGAGALVAAVEVGSATTPVVIGKPGPLLLEVAAGLAGRPVTDAIMIGDSLKADIAAANGVGARSILMLTGISSAGHVDALPAESRPTAVAADASELAAVLEAMAAAEG